MARPVDERHLANDPNIAHILSAAIDDRRDAGFLVSLEDCGTKGATKRPAGKTSGGALDQLAAGDQLKTSEMAPVPAPPSIFDKVGAWEPGGIGNNNGPSEDRVAEGFVECYRHDFRYAPAMGRWLVWNGTRWDHDSTNAVRHLIRLLVRRATDRFSERSTANSSFVAGVEKLLRADQRIVVRPEHLDSNPWMLNTQSGIVDLLSGKVGPHDPGALCTKITRACVDEEQGRELWDKFLGDITQGNAELTAYLQRVAGYAITGVVSEDVLVYLVGGGANGKSSFVEALAHTMGDYARAFPQEVLMESKNQRHLTELAQFTGVRLAYTSEPPASATLNDSRVKSLTGDATISARFCHKDLFEFQRTHKTIVMGNHLPNLTDVGHAMRRRLQVVRFRATFNPSPGDDMRERLKDECAGAILAWAVDGARLWAAHRTSPPASVIAEIDEYFAEQDDIGRWLRERCESEPTARARSSGLYDDYVSWCKREGMPAKSNKELTKRLRAEGFHPKNAGIGTVFPGLSLRDGGGCGGST